MFNYHDIALQMYAAGLYPIPHIGKAVSAVNWPMAGKDGFYECKVLDPDAETRKGGSYADYTDMFEFWADKHAYQNIGILTGSPLHGKYQGKTNIAVDFDGLPIYDAFCKQFPQLSRTLTTITGSQNGRHVHWLVDAGLEPDSITAMKISMGEQVCNIEVKSVGKSIILPPSIYPKRDNNGNPIYYRYDDLLPKTMLYIPDISPFVAWVRGFMPQSQQRQLAVVDYDNAREKLIADVGQWVRGLPHFKEGRGGKEYHACCPNHDEKNPSFSFNVTEGVGNCFVCGGLSLRRLAELAGLDYDHYRDMARSSPIQTQKTGIPENVPKIVQGQVSKAPVLPAIVDLNDLNDSSLDFDTPLSVAPIPMPYEPLYEFGGFGRVLMAGKVMGLMGLTGGGKTKVLGHFIEGWLKLDCPVLCWSPEWTAQEQMWFRKARYGAPSYEDMMMHYLAIESLAKYGEVKQGKLLSDMQKREAEEASETLKGIKTPLYTLPDSRLTIRDFGSRVKDALKESKPEYRPRLLVVDYIQRLWLNSIAVDSRITINQVLNVVKQVAEEQGLFPVIGVQVNKDASREVMDGKRTLGLNDGNAIRADAFNLAVTITPEYDNRGNFLPTLILSKVKDSAGRSQQIRVEMDWMRGKLGRKTFDQTFNKKRNGGDEDLVF